MTAAASVNPELRDLYARESAAIQQEFSVTSDGRRALARRAALVDTIVQTLWNEIIVASAATADTTQNPGPRNFALVATGGYGRGWLFPHSDIDLLFLHAGSDTEAEFKDAIRRFSQELWDLRLKLSPATRSLSECDRLDPNNLEFAIALLDSRYLAGDRDLFARLHEKSVPRLVARECHALIQNLAELTRSRHHKFGNTVFHLEPNVKDGPGGLRDYNVTHWLALISAIEKLRVWPDPDSLLPASSRRAFEAALDFQMSVRCFLHFRNGRDDNMLSWDAQEEAATRKIGVRDSHVEVANAADWMRIYFGHVRGVHRVCNQLLEEIPAAWSSLYRQFLGWRSKIASNDFSVVDGLIFLQQPAVLQDPEKLLGLFHFMAEHGLTLSTTTEYKVEQALASLASTPPRGGELWLYLQETLVQPHAADALRAMNALRLLTLLLPELKAIEALVVRDFYHRYTVDEHSFLAIEHLHRLKESKSEGDRRFAELLSELEQPELLYLSLLLHDSGKGVPSDNHVEASLELTESCAQRLDLDPADRDTVRYLVASHLEMSAAMRRDVFDPANVKSFSEKVGVPERLKMLCLMTYADIKAVNPDAMTPWKADNLWQLYISCANCLSRSADERVHTGNEIEDTGAGRANLAHIHSLAAVAGKKINVFLEGMPQRYLRIHGATDVLAHTEMASRLGQDGVLCELKQLRHWYELTLITTDRPFLFASVSGALAAWGMNIVKANAFSNAAGTVVDTFYFTDRFRTLEMNIQEWDRLKKSIADVLKGKADLVRMLRDRLKSEKSNRTKVKIATQIEIDDRSSTHSTLVQVLTQDRPGLLYRMCSVISKHGCNIEIALIETEGQMAIDVFYLTSAGAKLSADRQTALSQSLEVELAQP
jgi:[protein-PII] uridylyltransferase